MLWQCRGIVWRAFIFSLLTWLSLPSKSQAHNSNNDQQQRTLQDTSDIFSDNHSNRHKDKDHRHHHHDGGCGAHSALSLQDERIQQVRLEHYHQQRRRHRRKLAYSSSCDDLCERCIRVRVRLHMLVTLEGWVPHPTDKAMSSQWTKDGQSLTSSADMAKLFDRNLKLLNVAFRNTPFFFELDEENVYRVMPHAQATWNALAYREWIGSQEPVEDHDDDTVLNVYLAHRLLPDSPDGGMAYGFSTFPSAQTAGDGVYLRYDVVTGGGRRSTTAQNLDLGYWLVHETGHWLGLLHTFQTYRHQPAESYRCQPDEEGFGDFVDDTPLQRGPSSLQQDCKAHLSPNAPVLDTCPDLPGVDALFNYMNYVDDHLCWVRKGQFTCGQTERMYAHWELFREHKTLCEGEDDQMEVELVVALDGFHKQENRILLMSQQDGTLYDSFSDQQYSLQIVDGPILIDRCVPRSQSYTLSAQDTIGNGFNAGGKVELYVDRVLMATMEGDFGSNVVVPIDSATVQPTPSLIPEITTNSPMPSQFASTWPSDIPSLIPSTVPSVIPSASAGPSLRPSPSPSVYPTTTYEPSVITSLAPSLTTTNHSKTPSNEPSQSGLPATSTSPTAQPSLGSSTSSSTQAPSSSTLPSSLLSNGPSSVSSFIPTLTPSGLPSSVPTVSPSSSPTDLPSGSPSPTSLPSATPTDAPSIDGDPLGIVPTEAPTAEIVQQNREANSSACWTRGLSVFFWLPPLYLMLIG